MSDNFENKILFTGAVLIAGFFLWQKLTNPEKVSENESKAYVASAASASNSPTWFAPLQNKQALQYGNTTYFFSAEDFNNMQRWQRIALSLGIDPKVIF